MWAQQGAMLTRKDSEWKGKFEEPWQSRPRLWREVGHVFLQGRVEGLAQDPLTRQGGDALRGVCNGNMWSWSKLEPLMCTLIRPPLRGHKNNMLTT